jgi:hypothetical protein
VALWWFYLTRLNHAFKPIHLVKFSSVKLL